MVFTSSLNLSTPKGKDEQGNPIPGHRLYRQGDSWCEELNCSPHEFRRMFDAIGVRWNSKSEFMNATDSFCGRGYCSYVDRKENLTHYFRNHALVDAFLDQFVTDGAQKLRTSEKRSTELHGFNTQSPKMPASIIQRLPAEITATSAGGMGGVINFKVQPQIWQKGKLEGSIEDFISSAVWMQLKCGGVQRNPGFKATVRKRIVADGPFDEDWETLMAWRASQAKLASEENPEGAEKNTEKKRQLAYAKQRYAALDEAQQKEIESRFAVYLQANNTFVSQIYLKSGLKSGAVAGAFNEWLVGKL